MKSVRTVLSCLLCAALLFANGCFAKSEDVSSVITTDAPDTEADALPEPVPVFSADGGLYGGAVRVSLAPPDKALPGSYVAYTENGDEPAASSEKYAKELEISETAVIRAALFSADGERLGRTVTNTYVIAEPSSLMTVALAADNDDLYSRETGIFADRSLSGSAGERPVSVEIYGPDGTRIIHQDAGVRLAGSGSRTFDPASLRLVARSFETPGGIRYGGGKFRADLFGDGFEEYDRLLLRNGGNDSPYQAREKFLRMNMLRDCIANEYCCGFAQRAGVSVFAQRCVPVRVYLNGEYYGLSVMKEDFDERLISERFGLEKDLVTVIKGKKLYYKVEAGDPSELDEWLGLCGFAAENAVGDGYDGAYGYVSGLIDTDNAAAYLAVMLYLCNTDWPQNNAMVWRYTGKPGASGYSDGKWRFVIRDMDLCFALHDEPSRVSKTTYSMADTDTFYRLLVFYREGKGYDYDASLGLYGDDMKLQGLFDFLLRSGEFREKFKKYCGLLLSAEEAGYMNETAVRFREAARDEAKRHVAFWKEKGKIYRAYTFGHWERSFDDIAGFISDRPRFFRRYMNETLEYYE